MYFPPKLWGSPLAQLADISQLCMGSISLTTEGFTLERIEIESSAFDQSKEELEKKGGQRKCNVQKAAGIRVQVGLSPLPWSSSQQP